MRFLTLAAILLVLCAAGYWLLVVTEGAFLGRRFVVWLYDRFAARYDRVKEYTSEDETILVVEPLLSLLRKPGSLVLDVATGTGRVPQFLCADPRFDGSVIALDASRRMLERIPDNVPPDAPVARLQAVAGALPLGAATVDAVVCLESLEFFPSDVDALAEMARVLRPDGALMITRRADREARLFLHRFRSRAAILRLLTEAGFVNGAVYSWQSNYDLVVARRRRQDEGDNHKWHE